MTEHPSAKFGPALLSVWDAMTEHEQDAFLPHLMGGTSADWLAQVLRDRGYLISATTIRTYRRSRSERTD